MSQTRQGGVYPKILVFWWQEVKGQFWPILSLILFLFCIMLFNNKLSNLSLSVTFCFPIFRSVCVSLKMSKIQKRFIFGQNLRVMEIYWTLWNISWIQSTKSHCDHHSLLSSCTVMSNSVALSLLETHLHKFMYSWLLTHWHHIVLKLVLQLRTRSSINSKRTGNSYVRIGT